MKKQVVVNVSGKHDDGSEIKDEIEITTVGTLYSKETGMYLVYDEILGDSETDLCHNRVKIEEFPTRITINKTGVIASSLCFEEGSSESSNYATPYGEMTITTTTKRIGLVKDFKDESLHIEIEYSMDVNYERTTDSLIVIHVTPCEG